VPLSFITDLGEPDPLTPSIDDNLQEAQLVELQLKDNGFVYVSNIYLSASVVEHVASKIRPLHYRKVWKDKAIACNTASDNDFCVVQPVLMLIKCANSTLKNGKLLSFYWCSHDLARQLACCAQLLRSNAAGSSYIQISRQEDFTLSPGWFTAKFPLTWLKSEYLPCTFYLFIQNGTEHTSLSNYIFEMTDFQPHLVDKDFVQGKEAEQELCNRSDIKMLPSQRKPGKAAVTRAERQRLFFFLFQKIN
jgi:hypothetical protein